MFETGTNEWRQFDTWPPQQPASAARSILHDQGKLSFEPPADSTRLAFDEYLSDPAKPVPYIDQDRVSGMTGDYMIARPALRLAPARCAGLSDGPVLDGGRDARRADRGSTCSSPPRGTDSDWIVKLIDVYPDDYPRSEARTRRTSSMGGYQQLVRGDVMRGKFRNSFEKPEPFVPGKPDDGELHAARRRCTPSGPATGSWCRCRARGFRWSIATRRSSSTSTRRRSRTSRKRRSACTDRARWPRISKSSESTH